MAFKATLNADGSDPPGAGGRHEPPHGQAQALDRGGGHGPPSLRGGTAHRRVLGVMVSFSEPEQMEQLVPYRVVFDRKRSAGPLAGLEAGLMAAHHDIVFAVGCDMPYVERSTAELAVAAARNCDAAIPRHDGLFEPVCGAYSKSALHAISGALDAGNFVAHDVADYLDVTWLEGLDPAQFESLNTQSDLERFHAAFSAQR